MIGTQPIWGTRTSRAVPNKAQGDLWGSIIQNSNCVITSAEFVGPDGNIEIGYSWRN